MNVNLCSGRKCHWLQILSFREPHLSRPRCNIALSLQLLVSSAFCIFLRSALSSFKKETGITKFASLHLLIRPSASKFVQIQQNSSVTVAHSFPETMYVGGFISHDIRIGLLLLLGYCLWTPWINSDVTIMRRGQLHAAVDRKS